MSAPDQLFTESALFALTGGALGFIFAAWTDHVPRSRLLKIEHTAYQVPDPAAAAKWYVAHLGMTIKRSQHESPFMHFLADGADAVMLEFYRNPKVAVPDYRAIDPVVMHIAFYAEDIAATRTRLLAAGATPEGDITTMASGDQIAMLRDPWGVPVQLVWRREPMLR